jgi:hypothetical protein
LGGKAKFYLVHAVKTYGVVKVWFHTFSDSGIDGELESFTQTIKEIHKSREKLSHIFFVVVNEITLPLVPARSHDILTEKKKRLARPVYCVT